MGSEWMLPATLVGCSFAIGACGPPPPLQGPGQDPSPPGFAEVLVRVESPNPPTVRGEFNITSANASTTRLQLDQSLRLLVTGGDSESGITGATVDSLITWQCADPSPGGELVPATKQERLNFTPPVGAPSTPQQTPFQLDAVASPFAQTGCATGVEGNPGSLSGRLTVVLVNGAGLSSSSGQFGFEYNPIQ